MRSAGHNLRLSEKKKKGPNLTPFYFYFPSNLKAIAQAQAIVVRRRLANDAPSPTSPKPSRAKVPGSGTLKFSEESTLRRIPLAVGVPSHILTGVNCEGILVVPVVLSP